MSDAKIDVHHHVYPPVYTQGKFISVTNNSRVNTDANHITALKDAGGDPSGWFVPSWTLSADQKLNVAVGIKTAILSVTAPGPDVVENSEAAAALARECNEYVAKVRDQQPDAYGFFAVLPSLFDTEACLNEIAYVLDKLQADGVVIYTRYGKGNDYLGHASFRPVWQELNRRKAIVFVHPTHAVDTALVNNNLPHPMFDYPQETGRAAIDLITSGTLRDCCKNCKIILSHAGGTLPYLIGRVAGLMPASPMSVGRTSEELLADARLFYYDTALSSNPATLKALFHIADPTHVLFGSDFPNAPNDAIKYFTNLLQTTNSTAGINVEDVYYRNAMSLFPRLSRA
jgi:predicted TIM-barrel fold metal-dependent hydrolase